MRKASPMLMRYLKQRPKGFLATIYAARNHPLPRPILRHYRSRRANPHGRKCRARIPFLES